MKILLTLVLTALYTTNAFVPFIDGGKGMPKIYDGWFDDQIAKQAATAMGKAIAAGNVREKEFVYFCWRKRYFNIVHACSLYERLRNTNQCISYCACENPSNARILICHMLP